MLKRIPLFLFLFLELHVLYSQQPVFQFLSPLPGSRFNRRETTISIRYGPEISWTAPLAESALQLSGSLSGQHEYSMVLSDDRRTIVVKPAQPFTLGETVTVRLDNQIRNAAGIPAEPFQYSFVISPAEIPYPAPMSGEIAGVSEMMNSAKSVLYPGVLMKSISLPPDFPEIKEAVGNVLPKWNIFLSNIVFSNAISNSSYLMVLNTSADPLASEPVPPLAVDFKWEPTGRMTYYNSTMGGFLVLDSSYRPIDTVFCGNGYTTDLHEIRMLPNGHTFLMGTDVQQVAMDTIVPGGNSKANVTGLIVQELDQNKNVIFQWRSWDHVAITDAIGVDFTASTIDAVHGNALEIDSDTSIVISSRHLSEITKIDRRTGDIIWRWGGKHNQFTMINDSIGFSYQHAIRKIANGHYTMFDNGNFRSTSFSRAAEYALDEQAKTAALVWSYRHTPDISSFAMGYVQRLDDGSTLIGWGAANPSVTLLDQNDSTMMEMSFNPGVYSYRAYAYASQSLTSVSSSGAGIPVKTGLLQNYPNPFNPSTIISFTLPEKTFVSLKVFDILGKEAASIVSEEMPAGSYNRQWNAANISSGIYFYRLQTGSFTETKKMILLK